MRVDLEAERGELSVQPIGKQVPGDGDESKSRPDSPAVAAGACFVDAEVHLARDYRHCVIVRSSDGRRDRLRAVGAREAINLDGGGWATLVHRGHLLNRPYSNYDQPAPESRPVVTAFLFDRI